MIAKKYQYFSITHLKFARTLEFNAHYKIAYRKEQLAFSNVREPDLNELESDLSLLCEIVEICT